MIDDEGEEVTDTAPLSPPFPDGVTDTHEKDGV
jgi:hypothetical protein